MRHSFDGWLEWKHGSCQEECSSKIYTAENIFIAGREKSSWECGMNDYCNKNESQGLVKDLFLNFVNGKFAQVRNVKD